MSIFGNTEQPTPVVEYAGYIEPNFAGLQEVVAESAHEAYQLQAGLYVSDIMMEEAIFEGTANVETLMEGFASGPLARVKAIITKLRDKVVAWFNKVKEALKAKFMGGAKFVKEFKEKLQAKSVKGFTYTGYAFTPDAGRTAVNGKIAAISKFVTDIAGVNPTALTTDSQASHIKANGKDEFDMDEAKKKLVSNLGDEELSEVLTKLRAEFRGGEDEKDEIEEFRKGLSKEEMIKFVLDHSKVMADIDKAHKGFERDSNNVLNAIKKAESKLSGEKTSDEAGAKAKARWVTAASQQYQLAHYGLSVQSQVHGVMVESLKAAHSQFSTVLKSFLSYKPAKEGFELDTETTDAPEGILESAMRFV